METQLVYDATHADVSGLPGNYLAAGYVTGSADIVWTDADWAKHPKALRIDQSPISGLWDGTADADDYENGAVLLDQLAMRAKGRQAAFQKGVRPGQREPLVYVSYSNMTPVVNALIAGGVKSLGLWVARWGSYTNALSMVQNASGPFPVKGVQYANGSLYDVSVFNTEWVNNVSAAPVPTGPVTQLPGGNWIYPIIVIGKGVDNNLYTVTYTAPNKQTAPVKL